MAGTPGRRKRSESRYTAEASRLAVVLRRAREQRDLTQEQLAVGAGVCVSTVRKIERCEVVEPGYFTIVAIAKALGLSLAEIED
ncbi:multiprotein-bridging factor 1 family protein [Actinomadura sp. LOL_016]|uniref:helix-turn-helix domain-containing protein n=1 Tax=unclassified Actinomadura TaxID=2626254 RepID=UPI003A7FAE92